MGNILTFNVGSSSLKIAMYVENTCIFSANVDLLQGHVRYTGQTPDTLLAWKISGDLSHDACQFIKQLPLTSQTIFAYRVVHGGEYLKPQSLSNVILDELERLAPLCPLHQPPALAVIKALMQTYPQQQHIAAFDTTFHAQQPDLSKRYALPLAFYQQGIKSYGFHGLSCQSIMRQLAILEPNLHQEKVLIAHLGNGASVTAVYQGQSQASSMGFSTLDGLVMGTRCGHLDAGILLYLLSQGWDETRLSQLLYKESGLLGLSGISSDIRTLLASDADQAKFAVDYFCQRVAREISSLATVLGGCDCLVLTGGIGENQPIIRQLILQQLSWLGVIIHDHANQQSSSIISTKKSKIQVLLVHSDEQYELYLAAKNLCIPLPQRES